MANSDFQRVFVPRIRSAQIVTVVLLLGLAGFAALGYSVYLEELRRPPPRKPPIVAYLGLGMLAGCTLLSFLLPGMIAPGMVARSRKEADSGPLADDLRLLASYETVNVVGTGLLLGPAYFCLLSLFAERSLLGLAAAAFSTGMVLARFPTCARAQAWADRWRPTLDGPRPRS